MEESPMAISASQELLKAAPCIEPGPDSESGSDSDPDPVTGSDPDCPPIGSGITDGESLEDFRLSFYVNINFQNYSTIVLYD